MSQKLQNLELTICIKNFQSYKYNLISSSLTAEGVKIPKSVNNKLM